MPALQLADLASLRSIEDIQDQVTEAKGRMTELNAQFDGQAFPDAERDEFRSHKDYVEAGEALIGELRARKLAIERLAQNPKATEQEAAVYESREAQASRKERDIYDLSTIRSDFGDPESGREELRDRAMRAVEITRFPLTRDRRDVTAFGFDDAGAKAHVAGLLDRDRERGDFAHWILATGAPAYCRAWAKTMSGNPIVSLTSEEQKAVQRAVALTRQIQLDTTGLPVPFQLDATVLPSSSGTVNPWRQICDVAQITVNEWKGATAIDVVASYAAESTETTDNKPTLAQPDIKAARAQVFIPFSIEAGQDWGALQTTMARLIAFAKDNLEAEKFFDGTGTDEPDGLDSATGAIDVATAAGGAFAVGDLYLLENGLGPRFRARASIVGNRAQFNRTRQFDVYGGAALWLRLGDGLPNRATGQLGTALLGYPTYEGSAMESGIAGGTRILAIGDFSYYKIVDRIGMTMELIPHLFGTARNYPTGQRGLFGFWRNGGKLLAENAFRFLKT